VRKRCFFQQLIEVSQMQKKEPKEPKQQQPDVSPDTVLIDALKASHGGDGRSSLSSKSTSGTCGIFPLSSAVTSAPRSPFSTRRAAVASAMESLDGLAIRGSRGGLINDDNNDAINSDASTQTAVTYPPHVNLFTHPSKLYKEPASDAAETSAVAPSKLRLGDYKRSR